MKNQCCFGQLHVKAGATIIGAVMMFIAVVECVLMVMALSRLEGEGEKKGQYIYENQLPQPDRILASAVFLFCAIHSPIMASLGAATAIAGKKGICCLYWPFLVVNGLCELFYFIAYSFCTIALLAMSFTDDNELSVVTKFVGSPNPSAARKGIALLLCAAFVTAFLLSCAHKWLGGVVYRACRIVNEEGGGCDTDDGEDDF